MNGLWSSQCLGLTSLSGEVSVRAACPSHLKPRWLPSVDHSPRSDLSHGQVPGNPEEGALQRPCSPKPGRRHGIKGSVLQQQISSLRGSHGLCCYFVSPCSFNPLSPQKGIFCVWPRPRALVNFLPAPAPDSPSCADLPGRGHPHTSPSPGSALCLPGYTSSNAFPLVQK